MKPLAEQNLYEILEVPADAPEAEIVKAWDRVSALCAPGALATYTLMPQDDAALLGRRLEEALTVLLDPIARQRYDESLSLTPVPRGGDCGQASASGPEETPHPRVLPPVIRPRPMPPIIPPLREVIVPADPAVPAPIPLERVAPGEASEVAAQVEAASPIRLATPAPVAPSVVAVVEAPRPTPAAAAVAPVDVPVEVPAPAPVAAPPRPQEIIVGDGTRYTGDVLRRAREARGITLQQLCERTKITRHHLENLEADRYELLPAPVYLRGMLMAMSKELRLDGQKVARSYLDAMAAAAPPPAQPARMTQR